MADSYVVLWSLDRCRWLQRVNDRGPLEVVFGGPHQSQPSISAVAIGDTIYPIFIQGGILHIVAAMTVQSLSSPEDYLRTRFGIVVPPSKMWDALFQELKRSRPSLGHRLPVTCADTAALSDAGSDIRFERKVPGELLEGITLGPRPGHEQPLKGVSNCKLSNNFSLQGHVRRLSSDSARVFVGLL
jgi:hypothetical protein